MASSGFMALKVTNGEVRICAILPPEGMASSGLMAFKLA